MDGFAAQRAGLARLADGLEQAAGGMDGPASTPPDPPNAGGATAAVSAVLATLERAAAALVVTASRAAGDVRATASSYASTDAGAARGFGELG